MKILLIAGIILFSGPVFAQDAGITAKYEKIEAERLKRQELIDSQKPIPKELQGYKLYKKKMAMPTKRTEIQDTLTGYQKYN